MKKNLSKRVKTMHYVHKKLCAFAESPTAYKNKKASKKLMFLN
jgi:hypothetical protein